jgi:hypothetical protein
LLAPHPATATTSNTAEMQITAPRLLFIPSTWNTPPGTFHAFAHYSDDSDCWRVLPRLSAALELTVK